MTKYTTVIREGDHVRPVIDELKGRGAKGFSVVKSDDLGTHINFETNPEVDDPLIDYLESQGMAASPRVAFFQGRKANEEPLRKPVFVVDVRDMEGFGLDARSSPEEWQAYEYDSGDMIGYHSYQEVLNKYGESVKQYSGHQSILDDAKAFFASHRMASSRQAAPNEMSGHNPNTPVRVYDTHPNEYFEEGDVVIPLDPEEPPVTGTVLSRVAEDRLIVDWGRVVAQEDVDDVIKVSEWNYTNSTKNIGTTNRPSRPTNMNLTRRASTKKIAFFGQMAKWGDQIGNFFDDDGSRAMYDHSAKNFKGVPNQLRFPQVQQILMRSGMHPEVIEKLAMTLDQAQHSSMMAQQQQMAQSNQQIGQGDFSQLGQVPVGRPGFGQNTLQFFNPGQAVVPPPVGVPPVAPAPAPAPVAPAPAPAPTGPTAPVPGAQPMSPMDYAHLWPPAGKGPTMKPKATAAAIKKAAHTRKAGIQELLYQASAIDALGHPSAAYAVRAAADTVALMHGMYRNGQTRTASRVLGTEVTKVVSDSILKVASMLRRAHLEEPANAIENAVVAALTYERIPV